MISKYQAYAAATQTMARTRQIVALYDGAIRYIQQAKQAIQDRRIEDRYHLLVRASDIISGLQGCLDFEHGGDVAKLLYQFYTAIDLRLFAIHHNNSLESCDAILAELKQMRDVWHEIDQNVIADEKKNAAPPPLASDSKPANPAAASPSVTFSA